MGSRRTTLPGESGERGGGELSGRRTGGSTVVAVATPALGDSPSCGACVRSTSAPAPAGSFGGRLARRGDSGLPRIWGRWSLAATCPSSDSEGAGEGDGDGGGACSARKRGMYLMRFAYSLDGTVKCFPHGTPPQISTLFRSATAVGRSAGFCTQHRCSNRRVMSGGQFRGMSGMPPPRTIRPTASVLSASGYGRRPLDTTSNTRIPNDHTSADAVAGSPRKISGADHRDTPKRRPTLVILHSRWWSMRTLRAATSPCHILWACRNSSPDATSCIKEARSCLDAVRARWARRKCRRDPVSMFGMASAAGRSRSAAKIPTTGRMFRWWKASRMAASFSMYRPVCRTEPRGLQSDSPRLIHLVTTRVAPWASGP
mmetsp:Transcript_23267/g.60897  ORF Transcript_23267/g.60897 Transcript_23267/m.60897 type:complete len:372 (+) Transcript_23267:393-1508(+)